MRGVMARLRCSQQMSGVTSTLIMHDLFVQYARCRADIVAGQIWAYGELVPNIVQPKWVCTCEQYLHRIPKRYSWRARCRVHL